jgi:hypothetical protein
MTDINIPAPVSDADKTLYITPGEIDVRLMFSSKFNINTQNKEDI